jgi:L-rhamnose mutarotase
LIRFLFNNKDVFAWSANDLCGVNRDVIEHSLNVDPSFRPRKQRLQKMSDDKVEGARNEVKRLLSAGVIREVKYPEWLANTVMVKKANGKCRMCIDFTDLNKACPKDEFLLPRIDSLVDAATSSELMSLLDCYSGYHQIWMKKEDEPKTSFITPSGTYCYLRMPEGLKNAGGSFNRMTAKVLHSQIDRNVLTYVDDIIVKNTKQENHIADLQETFANFRQAGLKLNPEKCVFGVKKSKFLGCLVSTKGIEANPSKIEAILRMEPPSTKKGAQWLAGRLASLNRFISRSTDMSDDKVEGARNEVKRLLSAGVIREVKYPEWLANTVMVKKANGKCRMCIDFTDLNKACPKDEFLVPRIDSLVDAAASSELMSLLDCYSGYHQIWMKKKDEPKTSFITPSGTYCYLRMPEGLKNARGSFNRMTAKVLHSQISRNVLTYVDDIIVKNTKQENHIADLQETFANFRQAGLQLNQKNVFLE